MNIGSFTIIAYAKARGFKVSHLYEFTDNTAAEHSAERGKPKSSRLGALIEQRYTQLYFEWASRPQQSGSRQSTMTSQMPCLDPWSSVLMRCDKRQQLDTKSYSCSLYRSGEISQRSSTPQAASEGRATKASHRTSQLTSHYRSIVACYTDVDGKRQ